MTKYEKYKYWLLLTEYDLETAKSLLQVERWTYVAVLCQQAVERLVKGMFVYHMAKEAPKSHNIPFLVHKLAESRKLNSTEYGQRFIREKAEYEDDLIDIMFYYVSDYPFSYKKIMDRFIGEDIAVDIYERTLKVIEWLKSFQTENGDEEVAS